MSLVWLLGTLALVFALIVSGIIFYCRRKKHKHLTQVWPNERLSQELSSELAQLSLTVTELSASFSPSPMLSPWPSAPLLRSPPEQLPLRPSKSMPELSRSHP